MRIHTDTITAADIYEALAELSTIGLIPKHIDPVVLSTHGSRMRDHAIEVQLGTYVKIDGDGRRWKNSGTHGADSDGWGQGIYAATYDEWGYFLAALYHRDENLWCQYHGTRAGFRENTEARRLSATQQVFDYMTPTELMHELLTP